MVAQIVRGLKLWGGTQLLPEPAGQKLSLREREEGEGRWQERKGRSSLVAHQVKGPVLVLLWHVTGLIPSLGTCECHPLGRKQ